MINIQDYTFEKAVICDKKSVLFFLLVLFALCRFSQRYLISKIFKTTSAEKCYDKCKKVRRNVGNIPPVYPNGWFGLTESWKLQKNKTLSVSALGIEFTVYRDEQGKAHINGSAWANINTSLENWNLEKVSLEKNESRTNVFTRSDVQKPKHWWTKETNGWIFVWFHAEGVEPLWTVPDIQEISNGQLRHLGTNEHYINTHIQEISENSADFLHFRNIHEPYSWNGAFDFVQFIRNLFIFDGWEQMSGQNRHVGRIKFAFDISWFGYCIPKLLKWNVIAYQIGPGVSHYHFEGLLLKFVVIHTITPVEPMVQRYTRTLFMHWAVPRVVGKLYMKMDSDQIRRDILIWSNKTYVDKPVFTSAKEDRIVAKHRRWYSQFYTENSPVLKQIEDTVAVTT